MQIIYDCRGILNEEKKHLVWSGMKGSGNEIRNQGFLIDGGEWKLEPYKLIVGKLPNQNHTNYLLGNFQIRTKQIRY